MGQGAGAGGVKGRDLEEEGSGAVGCLGIGELGTPARKPGDYVKLGQFTLNDIELREIVSN